MATQNDDPLADLAKVRDDIRRTEDETLPGMRERRDELICIAREHGYAGETLAEYAGISRQSVHNVLRAHAVPAPNRPRSADRARRRARMDLRRALVAAGLDPDNITPKAMRAALVDPDTEHETKEN